MRSIKFRAWDNDSKKWYAPTHAAYRGELFELLVGFSGDLSAHTLDGLQHESMWPDRFVLMQSTGLKDENGVDIYEGDLVAPNGGYEDGECDHLSEVHWNGYNLQWEALCRACANAVPLSEFDLNSVLGNIYQNPDLLVKQS